MKKESYSSRDLRLLVTQKCVYNCLFCHGEGLQTLKSDGFNAEDFSFIYEVGNKYFSIKSVTLTGGEPLVRPDIIEIAKSLKSKGAKITLTTNGYYIEDKLEIGRYLDQVNISFHVANKDLYEITVSKKNSYEKAVRGIKLLRQKYPNLKIVLNSTCVKGLNYLKSEIKNIIKFAEEVNASIKFVELFPPHSDGYVNLNQVAKMINSLGFKKKDSGIRKLNFYKGETKISLTRIFCATAIKQEDPGEFCHRYNDLFVSPDGQIKPCRNNPLEIKILNEVKSRNQKLLKLKLKESLGKLGCDCLKYIGRPNI